MRGERQCHLVKTNVYIGMVVHFLGFRGYPVDKINSFQESLKLECPKDGLPAFGPVWDGLQVQLDLFVM